jgi:hypothetical protein
VTNPICCHCAGYTLSLILIPMACSFRAIILAAAIEVDLPPLPKEEYYVSKSVPSIAIGHHQVSDI